MDEFDWEWQRLRAESEFKDLEGDAFETRFQSVAKALWQEDFTPTIPMGRLGQAWEIGETVSFLLSRRASFITGQVLCADGGFTAR